jgi:hypothetical protein
MQINGKLVPTPADDDRVKLSIRISGVVKRRHVSKFGPFSRESWNAENFRVVLQAGETNESVEGLSLSLNNAAGMWQVEAVLKGVHFVLWNFPEDVTTAPRTSRFSILNVAKVQLYGQMAILD